MRQAERRLLTLETLDFRARLYRVKLIVSLIVSISRLEIRSGLKQARLVLSYRRWHGGAVVQWFALLLCSNKVLGFDPSIVSSSSTLDPPLFCGTFCTERVPLRNRRTDDVIVGAQHHDALGSLTLHRAS